MKNYVYLLNVDNLGNHNKYYEITQNDDLSLDVKYGRVGKNGQDKHYSPYEKTFDELYQSKIKKGYEDVTALHVSKQYSAADSYADLQYQPIGDTEVNSMIEGLIKASNDFMKANYTITKQCVTEKMIREAENDIRELSDIALDSRCSVWVFNRKLKDLFLDIPRRMDDVNYYMASTSSDFQRIIEREQDMIDNIKGQVAHVLNKPQGDKNGTVLDAYGLTVRPVTYKQEDEILAHLGRDYSGQSVERRFIKAFAVENQETRKDYENFKSDNHLSSKDCRLFYHGSKTENWFSILKQGLSLNPSASITGKMFGNGLYFAPDARKSLNYMDVKGSRWNNGTRDSGYMAVYSVALGKCFKPSGSLNRSFSKSDLPRGFLSVYADKKLTGLVNDEYVVYDKAQCTIKYLLQMSDSKVRELDYTVDRNVLRNELQKGFGELKKTQEGFRTELHLEKLSPEAQTEMGRILKGFDVDRLYLECSKKDILTLSCQDSSMNTMDIKPFLTKDDYRFLCREMKKGFAVCENDWKALVEKAEPELVGSVIDYRNSDCDGKKLSSQIHAARKEVRE